MRETYRKFFDTTPQEAEVVEDRIVWARSAWEVHESIYFKDLRRRLDLEASRTIDLSSDQTTLLAQAARANAARAILKMLDLDLGRARRIAAETLPKGSKESGWPI